MKELILKILKESEDEFGWVEDVGTTMTYGEVKNDLELGDRVLISGDMCFTDGDVALMSRSIPEIVQIDFERQLYTGSKMMY